MKMCDSKVIQQEGFQTCSNLIISNFCQSLLVHRLSFAKLRPLQCECSSRGEVQIDHILLGQPFLQLLKKLISIVASLIHVVFKVELQQVVLPHENLRQVLALGPLVRLIYLLGCLHASPECILDLVNIPEHLLNAGHSLIQEQVILRVP